MATKSTIQFVSWVELFGNFYMQFKINKEYFIYKFYCESVMRKIEHINKFSACKALNQSKKKCHSWWKQTKQWYGWDPEGVINVGFDSFKHKPVILNQVKEILTNNQMELTLK